MPKRKPRYSDFFNPQDPNNQPWNPKESVNPTDPQSGIGSGRVPRNGYRDSVVDSPSAVANYEFLLSALRSKAPGQWSQNLLELANHFTNSAFLAINTMANQTAQCEKKVFEKTLDPMQADLELPWNDALCRILDQPNDDDNWEDLSYKISLQLSLTGICLVWLPTYRPEDTPTEMYVLPSSSCLPWPPSPVYPNGSYLVQPYFPFGAFSTIPSYQSAAGARIPAEQVIRIKNAHPILNYDGYAVLTGIRRQVDTLDAIDYARWSTQRNGVDQSLILSFDPNIYNPSNQPDMNRIRVQLEAMYAGPQNAGRFIPVPLGTTVTKLSTTPSEMAWTEGWNQLLDFVMAAYGVPKTVAGMSDSTTYATLYATMKQFNTLSLDPHINRICSKFNSQYIKKYWGQDLYLKLISKKITDEDIELKKYTLALNAKSVKRNEIRKILDLSPLPGPEGELLVGKEIIQQRDIDTTSGHENDPDVASARPEKSYSENRLAELLDEKKHQGLVKHENNGFFHLEKK